MRWRKTKLKDKAKVITTKLGDTDKTLKEIEQETGVNYETARKIIKEDLPEVLKSSDILAKIVSEDLRIIYATTQIARRFTEETLEAEVLDKKSVQIVNSLADSAMRRLSLVRMEVETQAKLRDTKPIREMTTREQEEYIKSCLRGE